MKLKVKVGKNQSAVAKVAAAVTKAVKVTIGKLRLAVFETSGHRGSAFRLGEYYIDDKGVMHVRAVQERDPKTGVFKPLKDAPFVEIVDGCMTGDKEGKLAMAAYMNGSPKCNTAKVRQVAQAELDKLPKAKVKFQLHDAGYECRYKGNPNTKSVSGIVIEQKGVKYFWQAEQDRNTHNKHERVTFEPLTKGGKLVSSK